MQVRHGRHGQMVVLRRWVVVLLVNIAGGAFWSSRMSVTMVILAGHVVHEKGEGTLTP